MTNEAWGAANQFCLVCPSSLVHCLEPVLNMNGFNIKLFPSVFKQLELWYLCQAWSLELETKVASFFGHCPSLSLISTMFF